MKGRVGAGTVNRALPTVDVPGWGSGATSVDFRAAIVRNRHLWAVRVKLISRDREWAYVRIELAESAGIQTAWVRVDDLRPG